jgi:predicted nucleotidyltransferase
LLTRQVEQHPYPLIFATISGAHLYGFPSPDSDYDLRGCHILPVREVVGLDPGRETIEVARTDEGFELDLVTHDARKFFSLLLRKNGYVLEQVFSPLVVHSTQGHEELKALARGCVTKHHSHHYFGFAETQWKLFEKERPRRVKPLLYVYRVLIQSSDDGDPPDADGRGRGQSGAAQRGGEAVSCGGPDRAQVGGR